VSKKLPTVTSDIPRDLRTFLDRVRELIASSGGDRLVSANELASSGIATIDKSGTLTPPSSSATNLATPPAPTNVVATGAIQNIVVTWDDPNYFGHAYAEVWTSDTDNIGTAVLLGMAPGSIYVDSVGPSVSKYYWVRFVNTDNTAGPYNALAGALGETGSDVAYLLETLSGQITESELYGDLNGRIDEIDGGPGGDTGLLSKYTVKVDLAGHVAGYGIAATDNNGTPTSSFGIRADQFWIAPPSTVSATAPTTNLYVGYVWIDSSVTPNITKYYNGTGWQTTQVKGAIPFVVQTSPATVNGVSVPAGVYIDAAYIKNGTITNAKIGNAAIDDAKIVSLTAAKITAGSISVGEHIQSSNYILNSQGWKIFGNGTAEFAAASIRGQLVASQINANGLSIRNTSGTIILNAGTGDFTGTLNGTATSTVVSNASTALSTANTANTTANSALSGLSTKLNSDARNVLAGAGGLATGTLNWNASGIRTSGFGVGITQAGLAAYNSSGTATFVLDGTTGNASFAGDITAGTVGGNNVGATYVRSANYSAGATGWNIASNGNAEFNQITVRSGQVTGALLKAVKIDSYSGLLVQISGGSPVSTTSGPYYIVGDPSPLYLVGTFTMPAPETASHKIAAVVNVGSNTGSASKDLSVILVANYSRSGTTILGEPIAQNGNSGSFALATNAAGVSNTAYGTSTVFGVLVTGNNTDNTIQQVTGYMFGVR